MKNHRFVTDLGIAAYLLMHQFKVIGKRGKAIYFECESEAEDEFNQLILDYMPPSEFYLFDSCLMALKKINPWPSPYKGETTSLYDMGQAAYVLMKEYSGRPLDIKCVGKGQDRGIMFVVPEGQEETFKATAFDYLGSPYHTFDSCLMALKKIGEYTPSEE